MQHLMRTLVAGLCLLTSLTALAVDYDYERARRAWEDRQRQLNTADADLSRQQAALRPLQQRLTDAENRVDTLTTKLRNLRDDQRNVEIELSNNRSNIDRLRRERETLVRQQADAEADLRIADRDLRTAQDDLARSNRALGDLDRRIQDMQANDPDNPDLERLRRERDALAQDVNRKQQNVNTLSRRVADLNNNIRILRDRVATSDRDIASAEQRVRDLDTRLTNIRFEISDNELQLDRARDAMAEARSQRDRQQSLVDQAQGVRDIAYREERNAYAYYQQVLSDYNRAYAAATGKGRSDALAHSDREAAERGQPTGRSDGERVGAEAGRAAGLTDSREVATVLGYNHGLRDGASDATLATPYQQGRADGGNAARAKARAEDFPRSYNLRLNELFATPPTAEETHDISAQLPTITGPTGPLQTPAPKTIGRVDAPQYASRTEPVTNVPSPGTPSVTPPATDRRYYGPLCGGEPLPVFTQACLDAYAQAYNGGYSDGYRRHYQNSYAAAYRPAASSAYGAARQTQHPAIYAQAAGVGAHDLGVLNGFADSLAPAQAQAVADGRAAVEALRGQGFMPLLRSVSLAQAVDDGVYSPGEGLKVEVVIDNYGLKNAAHESLQIRISDVANANFSVVLRQLPALAADTRVRLVGVLTGAAAEAAGSNLRVKATLEERQADGSATTLDEASFEAGIRLPLELTNVAFNTTLQVGTAAEAWLSFRNNTTNSLTAAQLPLTLAGEGLTTTVQAVDLPALRDGETVQIPVTVTPTEYASNTVPVGFSLKTASIAGSAPLTLTKQVPVAVARVGVLELCLPTCGAVVSLPLRVRAGTTFSLRSQFRFTGTRAMNFDFGKLDQSDARITSGNGSTVRVGPGQWGPGSAPYAVTFSYVAPAALRGQNHWVSLYVRQGTTRIQVLKVPIVVE